MGWHEMVLRKKLGWEERILKRQEEVLLRFIETHGAIFGEMVVIISEYHETLFRCTAVGWEKSRAGEGGTLSSATIRFVLCGTGMFSDGESSFNIQRKDFRTIFVSDTFEVWESAPFYSERGMVLPLRLGLSETEKSWVTGEVRRMMSEVLDGKAARLEADSHFSLEKLQERQDLDVAVWAKGHLRASVIMIGQTLGEALAVGAKRATWDKRFAPLTKEELPEARIEITLMSDLMFPVLASDWDRNEIDATKGYLAVTSSQKKQGWYLPAVHNVMSFAHLRNMLSHLATEKAEMTTEEAASAWYSQFAIFDWIETAVGNMTLAGPTEEVSSTVVSREEIRTLLDNAVSWLCRIQKPDGAVVARFFPKGEAEGGSLLVLGCTGHALAVYGQTFDDKRASLAAEKSWGYIKHTLDNQTEKVADLQHYYTLVYYLRLSLVLKKEIDRSMVETLVRARASFHDHPILWLQILSFLVEYEENGHLEYGGVLRVEVKQAQKVFEKQRELPREQLASYPELIAVYHGLWRLTGERQWKDKALRMVVWYQSKQQKNGAFPYSPGSTFVYTRGTGKIFETLACFPEENKAMLEKVFAWLRTMQYTKENTFFMNQDEQTLLVGGFRHDAFNREAWIDASAHVILGATRLLNIQR